MEVGYALSCEEHPPQELVCNAQRAEAAGFSFALISAHIHPWTNRQGHSAFVWSVIGAIAQATGELRLGTGVTCPLIRIHPVIVAHAAATAACLMPGRFFLGVGTGENLNEHVTGAKWPASDERLSMLEEAVGLMRELWTGDVTTSAGKHYRVDTARIYTLPAEPPPVFVSGFGPKATSLAARIGDGYISTKTDAELLRKFKDESGGKPAMAGTKVAYAPTHDEGVDLAHRIWRNAGLPGELSQVLPSPQHFEQASELVTREMSESGAPAGPDPEVHRGALQEYVDLGYDEVYVANMGPHYLDMIELFGREVLPALRG